MANLRNLKLSLSLMAMNILLMLTVGLMLSFGVFLVDFKTYFQTGSAVIGAVSSLSMSILSFSAPLTSIIGQRIGCRLAICIGCCLTSFGFFFSSLVQRPWHLLISHSILTGLGCGLSFINIIPLIGIFPKNHLALANGIVYCGNSVGVIMFPMLCKQLSYYYGFRGAIMIVSALSMNGLVIALLMKFANEQLEKKTEGIRRKRKFQEEEEKDCYWKEVNKQVDDEDVKSDCDYQSEQTKVTVFGSLKGQIILCYKFPRFAGLLLANVFLSIGYVGFLVHMVANATYQGFSDSQSALVASIYGVGNIVGRLTHGIPIRYNWISTYHLFWMSCLVDSIAMFCYPFCSSIVSLFVATVVIAYNVGVHIPLVPVIVRIFVGDEYFQQAFGILQVPGGVGCLIGGFAAGWIYDVTNSYRNAFFFMGASYIVVPIIFLAIEAFLRRRRSQEAATMYSAVQLTTVPSDNIT